MPRALDRSSSRLGSAAWGFFLALQALALAGCSETSSSAQCVPGAGRFGDRCCAASDCSSGAVCHEQQCTRSCEGDAGACDGLGPDGGNPGCAADGFCVPPALPVTSGDNDDNGAGW